MSMTRSRQNDWTEIGLGIVLAVMLFIGVAFSLTGCTAAELNRVDPPLPVAKCDAQNPYLCPSGPVCCTRETPVCAGPDATGYYCEPSQADPSDPTNFESRARVRAIPRTDVSQ